MLRYLDFNDGFVSLTHGAGHPSDTFAALLTAAEINARSGRDLIVATVVADEVFCKIADVFDYLGNGIDASTLEGIGAVVGAGRLFRLSQEQMVQAIGITVGGNTATRQGARARCPTGRPMHPPTRAAKPCSRSSSRETA